MKSLVKLIISLGIKLALAALVIAIVMGFTSCSESDTPDHSSISLAFNQNPDVTEEIIPNGSIEQDNNSNLGKAPEPTSASSKANEQNSGNTTNNSGSTDARNDTVAKPTEQTGQDARNNVPDDNNSGENSSDSAQARTEPTATPTAVPTSVPVTAATSTPAPTSTPKPTSTPTPQPTNTPVPTATPIPEPTEAPEPTPRPAVAARVRVTLTIYGSDDPEGEDNDVSVTVYRTYTVQPLSGCSYHSYNVSYYEDAQVDANEICNDFYATYPNGVVHRYTRHGEEIIGFVDD